MTKLSTEDILNDKNTRDPNSITSLSLTHKALSDVSCLSDFKNLERLDLTFNNLTSLKGLELCLNLKWLSVKQNKLQSLKGIEGLTNLTVLNAGENKLKSMDEVKNLVKLRALILNDNEIASIFGLDQLKELNTLVLSRNPIRKMGNSLTKLKLIAKISLSNCQLEAIDSSIKACTELEQLRLAHNEIKTVPAEMANNKKLQILDLGNNFISRWSDLDALSSLYHLKNLNLRGNPIAEKAKLLKKINKLVPGLQIFNDKRMDKYNKIDTDQKVEDAAIDEADGFKPPKKKKKDHREKIVDDNANPNNLIDDTNKMFKEKSAKKLNVEEQNVDHMKTEKNPKKTERSRDRKAEIDMVGTDGNNEMKKQKRKRDKDEETEKTTDKRSKRKADKSGIDVIDDKETPFAELLTYSDGDRKDDQDVRNVDSISALVTFPVKKKKSKSQGAGASVLQFLTPAAEVGLGGPSAWGDE